MSMIPNKKQLSLQKVFHRSEQCLGIADFGAQFDFPQDANNLAFAEFRCLHVEWLNVGIDQLSERKFNSLIRLSETLNHR